jgi:hypothetical protein
MRTKVFNLILFLASATELFGQFFPPPPHLERLLLPIYVESNHGAFGSLWESELWVHNGTDEHLPIGPVALSHWPGVPPRQTIKPPITPSSAGHHPGLFIWIRRAQASAAHFNLRVKDLSRQSETWGTEIPVVRESAFRSDWLVLLNVPADTRYRKRLRIYEALIIGQSAGEVTVRLIGMEDGRTLWEQILALKGPPQGSGSTPYQPGYVEIPINAQFEGSERALIEIVPFRDGMKIWAFVSVTNNETQHVTLITPQ